MFFSLERSVLWDFKEIQVMDQSKPLDPLGLLAGECRKRGAANLLGPRNTRSSLQFLFLRKFFVSKNWEFVKRTQKAEIQT